MPLKWPLNICYSSPVNDTICCTPAYLKFVNMGTTGLGAPEEGKTRIVFYEDKCLELTVTPYGISVGKIFLKKKA